MDIATISTTRSTRPDTPLRRIFHPTNRKSRLLVGMLLGVALLQQLTTGDLANPIGQTPGVPMAMPLGTSRDNVTLEELARTDHIALLQHCLDNYRENYADYTGTLTRQERIAGTMGREQEIRVRFRGSPFSVAMTWVANPPKGDRIIYVKGRNNNEMQVRPTSVLLQALIPAGVSMNLDGKEAQAASLRTVDQFGFEQSMVSLLEVYRQARSNGDLLEEFGGYHAIDGQSTLVLIRYLTTRGKDYPAHKTAIYINVEYLLPVMVESYGWEDGGLLSRYVFTDLEFNVGLTEADFTPGSIGLKRN